VAGEQKDVAATLEALGRERKARETCTSRSVCARIDDNIATIDVEGSLGSERPVKRVGSFWPYATTVFDYIRRSMPFDHPRTMGVDEVYAVTAFVLHLNGLVAEGMELNEKNLAAVKMPNRGGFVAAQRPGVEARRMGEHNGVRRGLSMGWGGELG